MGPTQHIHEVRLTRVKKRQNNLLKTNIKQLLHIKLMSNYNNKCSYRKKNIFISPL